MTARGFQFRDKTGALFENVVSVMLRKRQLEGVCHVYFWRGPRDEGVDFVVKEGNDVTQLIQVCWDMQKASTREREVRALIQASKELSCENLLILTAAAESEEVVEWYGVRRKIRLLPLSAWSYGAV